MDSIYITTYISLYFIGMLGFITDKKMEDKMEDYNPNAVLLLGAVINLLLIFTLMYTVIYLVVKPLLFYFKMRRKFRMWLITKYLKAQCKKHHIPYE